MFLLDANVISELSKPDPAEQVVEWFCRSQDVWIPVPVIAELQYGAESAKSDARKIELNLIIDELVQDYSNYLLSWETDTSRTWARLQFSEAAKRQPQALWDSLIDAMAVLHGATVATRNTGDFRHARTFNPWTNELRDPASE